MSTAATDRIRLKAFNQVELREMPLGLWVASNTLIFDGSGGDAVLTFGAGNLAISEAFLWSVEDVGMYGMAAASKNIQITLNTMEPIEEGVAGSNTLHFHKQLVIGAPSATGVVVPAYNYAEFRPNVIFKPLGYEWTLGIRWLTQLGTESCAACAWGYYWDRDARTLGRGPRRG